MSRDVRTQTTTSKHPDSDLVEADGYLNLLRTETNFRRLWIGNLISLLGDWFNLIALLSVVTRYSGSPLALSLVFVAKFLPGAIVSPLAGYLVDRFDRRRLMIISDILRAIVVLGLLWVDSSTDVILALIITALQVGISSVFQPAQSAVIPNIVKPRNLLAANALMAISWSLMLAVGASVGGLATDLFGPKSVFVIDSVTYLVSAWFIFRTQIPQNVGIAKSGASLSASFRAIGEGWQRMRERKIVGRLSLAKATWSLGGGGLVFLLALVGAETMPLRPELGIGLLFAARGIGTGIGPIVAKRWFQNQERWPVLVGLFVTFSGVFYFVVGLGPAIAIMAVCVTIAHASSGANWVLSTVMLQQITEDAYRGRVFATEWLFVMLVNSVSILMAGIILELEWLSLGQVVMVYAGVSFSVGIGWVLWRFPDDEYRGPID